MYRHLPLTQIHQQALSAAEVVEAAGAQGQFFPMEAALFANQRELGPALYERQALALGLDIATFKAALAEHRYLAVIEADRQEGQTLGLRGTPSWRINGKVLFGVLPYDDLVAAITAARSGGPGPTGR